jgi:hypothetical protein
VRSGTKRHGRSGTKSRENRNGRFVRLAGIIHSFQPTDGLNSLTQKRNKISLLVVNVWDLWITSFRGGKNPRHRTSGRPTKDSQCTTISQVPIKAIRSFSGMLIQTGVPNITMKCPSHSRSCARTGCCALEVLKVENIPALSRSFRHTTVTPSRRPGNHRPAGAFPDTVASCRSHGLRP